MKVLILGHGAVGSVLANLLDKEKSIKSIVCGDRSFNEEKFFGKRHHKRIDLTDENELLKFLTSNKPDVVVNATHPKFNTHIMKVCLKARTNYIDTASFWDMDPDLKAKVPYKMEQMDYDKAFLKNNLFALIEAGVAPGLDNLIAAECASKLDEVDYIKIRMVEDTASKEIFFSWNKEWLLDELQTKPLVFENGKFLIKENFGGEEDYDFPEPIGRKSTCYFAQDEVGSIPLYIKTKNLDVKIHDNNIEVSKIINSLGLLSEKEINVDGMNIKPIRFLSKILPDPVAGEEKKFPKARFAMSIEAIGRLKKKKKAIKYSVIFPSQKEIDGLNLGANFISYPTALSVKSFIMSIPLLKNKGVFPPEALEKVVREKILKDFEKIDHIIFKKEIF